MKADGDVEEYLYALTPALVGGEWLVSRARPLYALGTNWMGDWACREFKHRHFDLFCGHSVLYQLFLLFRNLCHVLFTTQLLLLRLCHVLFTTQLLLLRLCLLCPKFPVAKLHTFR
jgi:hypothetical protein